MVKITDRNTKRIPLHYPGGRFPGWSGLNLATHEEFLPNYEASDCLNWTNRIGLDSDNIGVLCTRPGYADGPKYEIYGGYPDLITTYGPVRLLAKFFPYPLIDETTGTASGTNAAQVLRLVQLAANDTQTKFQYTLGAQDPLNPGKLLWVDIAPGTSLKNGDDVPAPVGGYYPQYITLGLPTPKFCWVDLENGLHVYDGTTDVAQAIPKAGGGGNITGALWLEQMDGRLIVSGNWIDAGEGCRIYYSGINDTTAWTSSGGGGVTTVYASDSRTGDTAPVRITGLATLHGMLVTFTEDMRYITAGLGTTMESTRSFPGEGCWSGKMISKYKDRLYWWGKDGAFEWNGGEVVRISDKIYGKKFLLTLLSAHKWFSFVYKDQWWTCVKLKEKDLKADGTTWTGDHKWRNFIYDFKTEQWYVTSVPMCAAFSSMGGLTDSGKLFFASPVGIVNGQSTDYKTYCYGFDDVDGKLTYADNCSGTAGARTGDDITTWWETGALDFESNNLKRFEKLQVRATFTNSPNLATSPVTYARAQFKRNATGTYMSLDFPSTLSKPYFDLGFQGTENPASPDNENNCLGHTIKLRWDVVGKRRIMLSKVFIDVTDLGITENEV